MPNTGSAYKRYVRGTVHYHIWRFNPSPKARRTMLWRDEESYAGRTRAHRHLKATEGDEGDGHVLKCLADCE